MTEKRFEDNQGWKAFMELRRQAQCSTAAGICEAEVEAEIAAYRSRKERSAK
jgi:DNA-damage-inducible protein J